MVDKFLEFQTINIAVVGDFNPTIFQPFWLSSKNLIREDEAKSANVELIHNDIVRFNLDWVSFEITRNRFDVRCTKEPYFDPVKDLTVGIFKILHETPIRTLGINHIFELALQNEKYFYNFGKNLAILDLWEPSLNKPKLNYFEVIENERGDGKKGSRRVRLRSAPERTFGVTLDINNHFNIDNKISEESLVNLIGSNWQGSLESGHTILANLFEKNKFYNE